MRDLKELISKMTVEEKLGQLSQHNANVFTDTTAALTGINKETGLSRDEIATLGSVLNFKDNIEMRKIQDEHLKADRNKIPLIFMMDVVHGYRTVYPIPLAMGCSFDEELQFSCSRMAAKEATLGGIQASFSPMVDYTRDARWGRIMETYGEDVMLNSIMGASQVKAYQGDDLSSTDHIAACVKHFAAYGGAEAGRDYNAVEISEHLLREFYLPAYKACIDAGVKLLMPSFNTLNGVPATVNSFLMKKILKDEWNYDGVVISDYNAIGELETHGITDDGEETARLAFDNGCDVEMVSTFYIRYLKKLIEKKIFTVDQLDNAVYKILKLKEELGLFEDPYHGASAQTEPDGLLTAENRALAEKAAEECSVLLKNDGVLPFSKNIKKLALIGPFADSKEIIGSWSCNGRPEESVTVKEGISRLLPGVEINVLYGAGCLFDDTEADVDNAVKLARESDAVLLCLGEPYNYTGEGNSRASLELSKAQLTLASAVCGANKNNAALIFSGRPLALKEISKLSSAVLYMWFPGTEGGNAAARLLFGDANPCGKLSVSFPQTTGQCPIYYNHVNTGRPKPLPDDRHQIYCSNYIDCGNLPLYSFGHGLSYSNFRCKSLTLSSDTLTYDGVLTVDITLCNDSDIPGKETVFVFLRDLYAENARPVQQLAAFRKIQLGANETKTVSFEIREPMLRFYNNENKFVSEKGVFEVSTGYADHLIFTKRFSLV